MSSAYLRLYNILRDKILEKEYEIGGKLPTERELCENYGVSRITSRHALRLLQDEGFVQRYPGRGTFVRGGKPRKVPILNIDYSGSIRREAPNIYRELVTFERRPAPDHIAEQLGLLKNEESLYAIRVDVRDNEPMAFDRAYFPLDYTASLSNEMLTRVDFLKAWLQAEGLVISHIWESIEACSVDNESKKLLKVSSSCALLLTTDVVYVEGGKPVASFETFYRGDRFRLISTMNKEHFYDHIENR